MIVACNGYLGGLVPAVAARVMPINNFIVATEPLGAARARGADPATTSAVADSRFVVNYFRLSADRRLLFGGGESYGWRFPADIAGAGAAADARRSSPGSPTSPITHAWGGTLAITVEPDAGLPAARRRASSPPAAIPATAWRWRRSRAS